MSRPELAIKYYFGLFCIVIAIIVMYFKLNELDSRDAEFPTLSKTDEMESEIKFISVERGSARVTFKNEIKRTISFARNNSYSPSDLPLFLKVNDILLKKMGSDSLTVLRDGELYYFLLGEEID